MEDEDSRERFQREIVKAAALCARSAIFSPRFTFLAPRQAARHGRSLRSPAHSRVCPHLIMSDFQLIESHFCLVSPVVVGSPRSFIDSKRVAACVLRTSFLRTVRGHDDTSARVKSYYRTPKLGPPPPPAPSSLISFAKLLRVDYDYQIAVKRVRAREFKRGSKNNERKIREIMSRAREKVSVARVYSRRSSRLLQKTFPHPYELHYAFGSRNAGRRWGMKGGGEG